MGLAIDDPAWDATVFTKNRDRLLAGDVAQAFFDAVLGQARTKRLLSAEHFTVDGTLVEAWASQKSFQPKGRRGGSDDDDPGNPTVSFRGRAKVGWRFVFAAAVYNLVRMRTLLGQQI